MGITAMEAIIEAEDNLKIVSRSFLRMRAQTLLARIRFKE